MTFAPPVHPITIRAAHCIFPPVERDEIAFAMALFMSAATHQLYPPDDPLDLNLLPEEDEWRRLLLALSSEMLDARRPARRGTSPLESTLDHAFKALWCHYRGDPRQSSICARILGFYYLAVRTEGAVIQHWSRSCPETPETVLLHPALVEAIATAPLSDHGLLSESSFLETVEELATASSDEHFCQSSPVTVDRGRPATTASPALFGAGQL